MKNNIKTIILCLSCCLFINIVTAAYIIRADSVMYGNITVEEAVTDLIELNKKNYFLESHPVGSIYITASEAESTPDKLKQLYGGTWSIFGAGKTLVSLDSTQTEFNTLEKTGGEKTHTLTTSEIPAHSHNFWYTWSGANNVGGNWKINMSSTGIGGSGSWPNSSGLNNVANTGGNQAHNNLQPYITVYMYKRIS